MMECNINSWKRDLQGRLHCTIGAANNLHSSPKAACASSAGSPRWWGPPQAADCAEKRPASCQLFVTAQEGSQGLVPGSAYLHWLCLGTRSNHQICLRD